MIILYFSFVHYRNSPIMYSWSSTTGTSVSEWLTITAAVLSRSISQEALRSGPHSGVAGLHKSRQSREEGVGRVRVNGLAPGRDLRSVRLLVQPPGDAQVASVLVHAPHVSSACVWLGTALILIWNTERCTENTIPPGHLWACDPFHSHYMWIWELMLLHTGLNDISTI